MCDCPGECHCYDFRFEGLSNEMDDSVRKLRLEIRELREEIARLNARVDSLDCLRDF